MTPQPKIWAAVSLLTIFAVRITFILAKIFTLTSFAFSCPLAPALHIDSRPQAVFWSLLVVLVIFLGLCQSYRPLFVRNA